MQNGLARFEGDEEIDESGSYGNTGFFGGGNKRIPVYNQFIFDESSAIYRENPNASVYFYDKRFFRGVMLIGTMEVLEDAEAKQMIWLEGDTMYYPQGVTDPDYCVLKFTAEKGRYYSNFKSEDFDVLPMSI